MTERTPSLRHIPHLPGKPESLDPPSTISLSSPNRPCRIREPLLECGFQTLLRRRSQAVRQRSAKPLYGGSIPPAASNLPFPRQTHGWLKPQSGHDRRHHTQNAIIPLTKFSFQGSPINDPSTVLQHVGHEKSQIHPGTSRPS